MANYFYFPDGFPDRQGVCVCATGVSAAISLPSPPPACEFHGRGRCGKAELSRACSESRLHGRCARHRGAGPSSIIRCETLPDKQRRRATMAAEPFMSALVTNKGEDTSLALPSDNNLRTGHLRVKDQVHSIKRSKSKPGRSSATSPVSPNGACRMLPQPIEGQSKVPS